MNLPQSGKLNASPVYQQHSQEYQTFSSPVKTIQTYGPPVYQSSPFQHGLLPAQGYHSAPVQYYQIAQGLVKQPEVWGHGQVLNHQNQFTHAHSAPVVQTHSAPVVTETHSVPNVQAHSAPVVQTHSEPVVTETHSAPIVQAHSAPIVQAHSASVVETHSAPTLVETHSASVETHLAPVETHLAPVEALRTETVHQTTPDLKVIS
jgi:hypothetical protein